MRRTPSSADKKLWIKSEKPLGNNTDDSDEGSSFHSLSRTPSSQKSLKSRNADTDPKKFDTPVSSKQVCRQFARSGSCQWGQKCRNLHPSLNTLSRSPPYKTRPCSFFQKNGRCNFGKSCKYSHEISETIATSFADSTFNNVLLITVESYKKGTVDLLNSAGIEAKGSLTLYHPMLANSAFLESQSGPNYERLINSFSSRSLKPDFAQKFIGSLFLGLYRKPASLLEELKSDKGSIVIDAFLTSEYSVSVESCSDTISFQRCLVPLITFLSNSKICKSIFHENVAFVFSTFRNNFDLWTEEYLNCLECLVESETVEDKLTPHSLVLRDQFCLFPLGFSQIFLPFVRVLYEMGTRFKDLSYSDGFFEAVTRFEKLFKFHAAASKPSVLPLLTEHFLFEIIDRELVTLVKLVNLHRGRLGLSQIIREKLKKIEISKHVNVKNPWSFQGDVPMEPAGKNILHDNDLFDISKISILPTCNEIFAKEQPPLPGNFQEFKAAHWLEPGPSRLLDTHFRLLREDFVSPIRDSIVCFMDALLDSKIKKVPFRVTSSGRFREQTRNQQADLNVYSDAKVTDFVVVKRRGLCAKVSFTVPKKLKSEGFKKSGRLELGTMIALMWKKDENSIDRSGYDIVFGVIADIEHKMSGSTGIITVAIPDLSALGGLFKSYKDYCRFIKNNNSNNSTQNYILEPNHLLLDAYRPLLKVLQSMDPISLPFSDYLCPDKNVEVDSKGFLKMKIPFYARRANFSFNLSSLTAGGVQLNLDPSSDISKEMCINSLLTQSTLDQGQSTSLVNALSSEICCIQGPPGTGKSYLGIQIVLALLANKSVIQGGPILVICFTNHALDQFLLDLLDAGVTNIARMGSRSTSERIQELSVENNASKVLSRDNRNLVFENFRKIEALDKNLTAQLEKIKSNRIYWSSLGPYLRENFYEQYLSLAKSASEDDSENSDFNRVYSKSHQKKFGNDVVGRWMSCVDLDLKQDISESVENAPLNRFALLSYESDVDDQSNKKSKKAKAKKIKQQINKPPRKLDDLMNVADVWTLSKAERHIILNYWVDNVTSGKIPNFIGIGKSVAAMNAQINSSYDDNRLQFMKSCKIVGLTTTGSAKNQALIARLAPSIIICEEAGEVLESHILGCLHPDVQQLILIGDHQQLRPHIAVHNLSQESKAGEKYRFDLSLFERLQTGYYKFPLQSLSVQRRMRSSISNLIRNTLYPELVDAANVQEYPNVRGMDKNIFFMHHENQEDGGEKDLKATNSHSNAFEVDMSTALLHHLLKQGYSPSDVVILTPYVGQLLKLRSKLKSEVAVFIEERDLKAIADVNDEDDSADSADLGTVVDEGEKIIVAEKKVLNNCVRVSTIDNYQGEEAKIIIISLVRNIKDKKGSIGFLAISNRINVLLSRAMHGMYLFGNGDLLTLKSEMWKKVIEMFKKEDSYGTAIPIACHNHPLTKKLIDLPGLFRTLAPDGGCTIPCTIKLPKCGHRCQLLCHSDSHNHLGVYCFMDCARLHQDCDHPCPKKCGEDCGNCKANVGSIMLNCGHMFQNAKCWESRNDKESIQCLQKVVKTIPRCGHAVELPCHQDPKGYVCLEPCRGELENCSHSCTSKCGKCSALTVSSVNFDGVIPLTKITTHPRCSTKCLKPLSCKHDCKALCHSGSECPPCSERCTIMSCEHSSCSHICSKVDCKPCQEPCSWICSHQDSCPLTCGAPCLRLPCNIRCDKMLSCGHPCPSICGEVCPSSKFCIECNADIGGQQPDFIMFRSYKELDLDEDPIIVLPCSHFFTVDTLDGLHGMSSVYEQTSSGEFTSLLPLVGDIPDIPVCPSCRCPIKNIKRYGRIYKWACLHVSELRFIITTHKMMNALALKIRLSSNDGSMVDWPKTKQNLESSLEFHEEKDSSVDWMPKSHSKSLQKMLAVSESLNKDIQTYLKHVYDSPHRNIYTASMSILSKSPALLEKFKQELMPLKPPSLFLIREGRKLNAQNHLNRFYIFKRFVELKGLSKRVLEGYVDLCMKEYNCAIACIEKSKKMDVFFDVVMDRSICDLGMVEMELELELYQFKVLLGNLNITPKFDSGFKELGQYSGKLERFKASCVASFLDGAQDRFDRMTRIIKSLRCLITPEEEQMIFDVMSRDFKGSGHFYNCPNGHAYTIGECGMAMEQSTCPECGVAIGGQDHTLLSNNTVSTRFENMHRRSR